MTLYVPTDIWRRATGALHDRPTNRERVAFLDGPRPAEDGPAVATTVVLPDASQSAGHYSMTAEAMSSAGGHLRTFGMLRLAQLHTHPSGWIGHSDYDDELAYSRRDGALSIVAPHYGACAPGLADCGIHVRDADGWRQLEPAEVGERVVIVPSLLDFRA